MISLYRCPRLPQQRSDSNEVVMRVSQAKREIISQVLTLPMRRCSVSTPDPCRDFEEDTTHITLCKSASER